MPALPTLEGEGSHGPKRNKHRCLFLMCLRVVAVAAAASIIVVVAWSYFRSRPTRQDPTTVEAMAKLSPRLSSRGSGKPNGHPHTLNQCPSNRPLLPTTSGRSNLWASLSVKETKQIEKWLRSDKLQLNLTDALTSKPSDNIIYMIETRYPRKLDALAYLDSRGVSKPPARFARVTIHHGSSETPGVRDYLVGPLPVGANTTMKPLTDVYHSPEIPFNARGIPNDAEWIDWVNEAVAPMAKALEDLFGGTLLGKDNDTLTFDINGPNSFDGTWRRFWIIWRLNVPGAFLQPVNFYNYVDLSGTDTSTWRIMRIVYHDQLFTSVDSFLEAYKNGTLVRKPRPDASKKATSWSSRERVGKIRDLDHLPGPRSVSFGGLRYRVDREQQYVTWLGWSLYLGFDRDMGLNLWDIRFRGERIIYELSPQEAIGQYSGTDPFQASTAWLDRCFGIGSLTRELIPGYDCPSEALYLPMDIYATTGSIHLQRAICIFEHDTGKPITTHAGGSEGETGATKSYVLTIRSIATIGNYDYLYDYVFYIDGTVEVQVSASGYLQGGYWSPEQQSYGSRISPTTMGSLHDHVINFKVDLDVAGLENSFLKTTLSQETIELPWYDEDWGSTHIQQRADKEYIETEDSSKVNYPPNLQGSFAIVNKNAFNAWDNPRGYAIHPGHSPIYATVKGAKKLLKNVDWAHQNLAVTLRKETEPSSSSTWNCQLPGDPTVDFAKFFNGENLIQQDLVLWINVGTHHLPHAEDAPHTKTNIASSSFMLTPMNYFDSDVSLESINSVLVRGPRKAASGSGVGSQADPNAMTFYDYEDYGVQLDFNCISESPPLFAYSVTGEPLYA